ncbi:unnamed protein product [Danaus chrysippus]|uniref:(African queen) hypothetical protein n=1 Tax=Danaus chrysippus TaxID=151541 RepID=A0A8J2R0K9_9NEOP|nr:unnamed protein product [Danaus chrysippus]
MTEVSVVTCKTDEKEILVQEHVQLGVKLETEVIVKQEVVECFVCLGRSREHCDLSTANTSSGTSLQDFLCKFTNSDLSKSTVSSKFVCKTCLNLVNVLEQAEIEYIKLKEEFKSIINKNPLFESSLQDDVSLESIKNECLESVAENDNDSEDEPLALTKKKRHRKVDKRKKKSMSDVKHKVVSKENEGWECGECSAQGSSGGPLAGATHVLLAHTLTSVDQLKKEESDRSQSPSFTELDTKFNIKVEGFEDDDNSSNYAPDDRHARNRLRTRGKRKHKEKDPKVVHHCDQCDAKYTSLVRLEHHKRKHDDSKPPYICEVCGAHYKHKRACDIHVAMHKGISDWKCEECNKLFPSKGALQRHNNIHTGKLNYQCDLCGKSFIHTSSFKMHKLSHSGVKPHSCEVCGLALMTRSHLKRHARVHSGEKRHECPVCGKRFSERYNLVAHARSHAEGGAGAGGRGGGRGGRRPAEAVPLLLLPGEVRAALHAGEACGCRPRPRARATPAHAAEHHEPSVKQLSQISSPAEVGSSWTGAYVAEFGLRTDYTH